MQPVEKDALDVVLTLIPADPKTQEIIDLSLPDLVARGRLFILNQNGEFEPVRHASYWKGEELLCVCTEGYEYNQDGEVTRDWR